MKIGDLVRCKVTKDANTVGVVVAVVIEPRSIIGSRVDVLTKGRIQQWSPMRLEVINENQ